MRGFRACVYCDAFVVARYEYGVSSQPASGVAFYGGALLIVGALLAYFFIGASGLDAVAFLLVLVISGFAMFRAWRDQHRYGY